MKKEGQQKNGSHQQTPVYSHWAVHKCWFAIPLTKDVIEEVHEEQHPGHEGHKDDDLERRVEEQVAALRFALSISF